VVSFTLVDDVLRYLAVPSSASGIPLRPLSDVILRSVAMGVWFSNSHDEECTFSDSKMANVMGKGLEGGRS
jgi:hypothetical protein